MAIPSSRPFCWHQLIASWRARARLEDGFEQLENTFASICSNSILCGCMLWGTVQGKQTFHVPVSSTLTISRSSVTS